MVVYDKKSSRELEIALNPIGSLALRERLERNRADKLVPTFNALVSNAVALTLSPNGYRIIECFLNASVDDVNARLACALSADWEGLEKVLMTVQGRYICETLLNRGLKAFAHRIISIVPRDWWYKNDAGLRSLHILVKAIEISEVDVANEFCADEQMEDNLCDSPEGLYCVLKVKQKSINQPGCKESLRRLILRKATSIAGSEALVQVLVYGDYLVMGIVAMICGRCESYDDSTTVSLIIRLIELGGNDLKQFIFGYLCKPTDNPLICRVRFSIRFDDFKQACDSHFTPAQRDRLDACLAEDRIESKVDECLKMIASHGAPVETMDTTASGGKSKKRRIDQPIASPNSTAKKPREAVNVAGPLANCHDMTTEGATVTRPIEPSTSSNSVTPGADSTPRPIRFDPGVDVVSMAMGEESSREILAELKFGSADYRSAIFECIQSGLLALMMDERGSEVVKLFIVNGCFKQNGAIERRVLENVECLVRSGGYGRDVVRTTIDECTNHARKQQLREKYETAMRIPRYSSLPSSEIGFNSSDEIEIVGDNAEKNRDKKTTVAKKESNIHLRVPSIGQPETRRPEDIPGYFDGCAAELHEMFNEILRKLKSDTVDMEELKHFVDHVLTSWTMNDARRRVLIELIRASISSLTEAEKGMHLLWMISGKHSLRTMLVTPIASVLHKLGGNIGGQVITAMLSDHTTCGSFIDGCLVGDGSCSFVKMFHSDMDSKQCVSIGSNLLARARDTDIARIHNLLTSFGRSIGETENGRAFIECVANPSPVGWDWGELLELLQPPSANRPSYGSIQVDGSAAENRPVKEVPLSASDDVNRVANIQGSGKQQQMITDAPLGISHEDTVASPVQTTTPLSLPSSSNLINGKKTIPSLFSFSFAKPKTPIGSVSQVEPPANRLFNFGNDANKNPFRLNRGADSSLSQSPIITFRSITSFKSTEIRVSDTVVPSFPTSTSSSDAITIRPPLNLPQFSFKPSSFCAPIAPCLSFASQFAFKQPAQPLSFSSVLTEKIVKDTVEFIVKTVVEANP